MNDIRQSPQYAKYLTSLGWQVERSAEINYFIKKLPLWGSILKIQRPEEIRIGKIKELAKKFHTLQIIIEPKTRLDADYLGSLNFRLGRFPFLPSKTQQLDLTLPSGKIKKGLLKDTRGILKKTKKLKIHANPDIGKFRKSWKKAVGIKRYVPPFEQLLALKKAFKKNCFFFLTDDDAAGAIFLYSDGIFYYWQAFTNQKGRKNYSQYQIVWQAILLAKRIGARVFDFEGIYDNRFPNKSWLGFTHFKKSFGGYEVLFPGTFVKWFV